MSDKTTFKRGVSCQISAFELDDPPANALGVARTWMAIASAHVYDANVKIPALRGDEALAGETMRVFHGRALANSEAQAMIGALEGLLYQLTANGFSANHDVKLV